MYVDLQNPFEGCKKLSAGEGQLQRTHDDVHISLRGVHLNGATKEGQLQQAHVDVYNPYEGCIKVGRRSYLRARPRNDTYNKHVWMVHQRCVMRCILRHVMRCFLRRILRCCFAMRRIAVAIPDKTAVASLRR